MTNRWHRNDNRLRKWAWLLPLVAVLILFAPHARAATAVQRDFASPEAAADALVDAVGKHDRAAVLAVLGPASSWIGSGDAVADRAVGDRFVAAYRTKHTLAVDNGTAKLLVGNDDYPFAFPIVRRGERWRFDAAAGREEMLARRIGENEIDTIKVLRAIVDAQFEYASEDRDGDGVLAYARKFASSPGKKDGLHWPARAGEPPSPLGTLVARAAGEGYRKADAGPTPYHGYLFRFLQGQSAAAASGAQDYVVKGRAIGGFAIVAYPAKYANSGIMTFIVNQDGKVFQQDLGPATAARAAKLQRFDPAAGWSPVSAP